MGSSGSKGKKGLREKKHTQASHDSDYEDIELLLLRKTIQRDPEGFVLNNLMLCVQFFKNYEEIEAVKGTLVSTLEVELNKRMPPQKHVLLPDVLQECVARNVGFTSTRQTFRPITEPLLPVRIYTVHDNVDITEDNLLPHYSSMNDSIMYNMLLQTTEHEGYIQLQLVEESGLSTNGSKEDDLSSIAEDDDEFYSDGDSVYCVKPRNDLMIAQRSRQRTPIASINGSMNGSSRSLPNLLAEDEILYEERRALSNSNRNLRNVAETDYENASSSHEKQRNLNKKSSFREEPVKGDRRRYEKHSPRVKTLGSANQSHSSSISSGYRSDNYAMDSDSSYNPTQNSRLERSSTDEGIEENCIMTGKLPSRCFKRVTYTADGKIYDPQDEKKPLLNSRQRRIKQVLNRHNYDVSYISSTMFMAHFKKMFRQRLAACLGLDRESVQELKSMGCVIHCDRVFFSKTSTHSRVVQYEIVPAFWLQWPECAQEWLDRPRSTWPDYDDIEKIKTSGCYVVPEGFMSRDNKNPSKDIEWQLIFPAAERYLETCMTWTQTQVYLVALMLHKTFMRPISDSLYGLTTGQIKHKLFWLIEENDRPSKWPGTRMGDCLMTLLNSLYYSTSLNEPTLRDYFVRGRNLFQWAQNGHLLYTQKQLKRIIENPVMYVIYALQNIRYGDNFFPRLDFEMLVQILTEDTLALINPALRTQVPKSMPQSNQDAARQDEKYHRTSFWDNAKKQEMKHTARVVNNKTLICRRNPTDSIVEISIRCAELEDTRLCVLLDFFIRHFIRIAERCNQYGAGRQKTLYLDHADRLSIILFEHQAYKDDARSYRDKIKVLRKKNLGTRSQSDAPETPKRNPESAMFAAPLRNRFRRTSVETSRSAQSNETLSGTEDVQSKRSDQSTADQRNTTKVMVHGTEKEDSVEQASTSTTSPQVLPVKKAKDRSGQVVKFVESSDSETNDSTFI